MTFRAPTFLAVIATASLLSTAPAINLVITDSGNSPADLQLSMDAFRTVLGPQQEVSWDGAPDSVSAPNGLPGDFFGGSGLSLTTPGTGFQLSATSASGTATKFGNLDAAFAVNFQLFSDERLFSPIGSVVTEARFFVSGTGIPALTDGFGAVFTGVEAPGSRLDFYDIDGQLVVSEAVPEGGAGSLSFLGVVFDSAKIARVDIFSGELPLDAAGTGDRVALDNVIFGQGQAIPEPSTMLLLVMACSLSVFRRTRR